MTMDAEAQAPSAPGHRDLELDAVKGFLVLAMAVYHSMNYFAAVPAEVYGYLRFVNGSFVFISGYVVATFQAGDSTGERMASMRRLMHRGAKLLAVFTALNLAVNAVGMTNYRHVSFDLANYWQDAAAIYGGGDAPGIAFRILMPIAYVLMLSGVYLALPRWQTLFIAVTLVAALLYMLVWPVLPNLFFVLTGLSGLSIGLLMRRWKVDLQASRVMRPIAIVAAFIALASVMNPLSGNVLAYAVGIALLLKLVYDGAALLVKDGAVHRVLVLLGRYSLVGYIAQIGFLFLLHRAWRGASMAPELAWTLSLAGTCAFLIVGCVALERLRRRSAIVEKTYRLVFA
jgi:hypothetical protein